jgi:hypothetical protein
LVPGPYVAETYHVVAEGHYLAVDVPAAGAGAALADG